MTETPPPISGKGASWAAKVFVMLVCLFGGIVASYVMGNDSLVFDRAAKRLPPPSLEEMAVRGDAAAQYKMGVRLSVPLPETFEDLKKAVQYFERAKAQGHDKADGGLCFIWALSDTDYYAPKKAFPLCERAAATGDVTATVLLALLYEKGHGTEKDRVKAGKLFEKAAQKKHPVAAYYLAQSYRYGMRGFKLDKAKAIEWFQVSARARFPSAALELVMMYSDGIYGIEPSYEEAVYWMEVARGLSPKQSAEFLRRRNMFCIGPCEIAAEHGDVHALFVMADKYFYASGEKRDLKKAEEMARKAALQKNGAAQYLLAEILAAQSPEEQTAEHQIEQYIWYATAGNSADNSGFKRLAAKAQMEKIWAILPTEHRKEAMQRVAENILLYAVQDSEK